MRLLLLLCPLFTLLPPAIAQTAGTTAPLIYSYDGQSAPASLLSAISTAAEPAESILKSSGSDVATSLVPAFATTATVGPTTAPGLTSSFKFSSGASGEIYSTATRPFYTATGTINTSSGAVVSASGSAKSAASRRGGGGGVNVSGVLVAVVVGIVVGARVVL